jgi:Zn-finger domain-containing protein
MVSLEKQIEELKDLKSWITDEEFKDISDSISEFRVWLKDMNL